ncbi:MAG TPA: ABC transporter permease [Jatrophihabitans sp.]|jgi:ABC-2 type transport system permease protein
MSAAEVLTGPGELGTAQPGTSRQTLVGGRFLLSELGMLLRRRRNQLILLVLAAVPIIIGIAVKVTVDPNSSTDGLIADISQNGIFVAFTALVVVIPVFLPMAIAVVSGESISGEANQGTLRYLLTVPVGRTRLLVVKFLAAAFWCVTISATVAVSGVLIGLILFPVGKVTLLSGTQTSMISGIGRLLIVVGYASLMMLAIAAIGLFISTLTEVPIAAMAATLTVAIVMQVLVAVPQLHAIHGLMISDYFLNFGDVIRDPLVLTGLTKGVLVALAYLVIFFSLAWSRFTTKDVTS